MGPMLITGVAEILVNPVVYQFAFEQAPPQLMSVVQAFNLVVAGSFSNCITGPLAVLLFPDDLDHPEAGKKVNYTFYANIACGLLCFFSYLIVDYYDEVPEENLTMTSGRQGKLTSFAS